MKEQSNIEFLLLDPGRPIRTVLDGLFCYGKEES